MQVSKIKYIGKSGRRSTYIYVCTYVLFSYIECSRVIILFYVLLYIRICGPINKQLNR